MSKFNRKFSIQYLIYVLLIILILIPLITHDTRLDRSSLRKVNHFEGLSLSDSPIIITNWSETALLYDWCSFESGSYKVKNLSFIINNETGLTVANTTEPFIIENCTFTSNASQSQDTGIKLVNASNGLLINNSFSFIRYSIFIKNSFNNSVISNYINCSEMHSVPRSIRLEICSNSSVRENYIINSYYGIQLENCNYTEIDNNILEENSWGIVSYSIKNCVIFNNTLSRSFSIGVAFIENCYYNAIIENVLTNSYYNEYQDGIALWHDSSNNSIVKNAISDNSRYGIDLRESLGNNVLNNSLIRNLYGIRLYKSNYSTVMYNYITYYEICILETDTEFNTLENNTCEITYKFIPSFNIWVLCLIIASIVIIIINRKSKKFR